MLNISPSLNAISLKFRLEYMRGPSGNNEEINFRSKYSPPMIFHVTSQMLGYAKARAVGVPHFEADAHRLSVVGSDGRI